MLEVGARFVLGALFVLWLEYLRRPRLRMSIEPRPIDSRYGDDAPARNVRTVRVILNNRPIFRLFKWMVRAPAQQCRASITFHHLDGQDVFSRSMNGRWSNSPQPVLSDILDLTGKRIMRLLNPNDLLLISRIDVHAGDGQPLDIAIRADDDTECYGWNNEAYFSTPNWRNPLWRLPANRYIVRVSVEASGQNRIDYFRLINDVPRSDFRLEPVTRSDINAVKAKKSGLR
jgi:hypothetical protein